MGTFRYDEQLVYVEVRALHSISRSTDQETCTGRVVKRGCVRLFTRFEVVARLPCGRFEEQLRQRHDAEMQRLQAEEEKVMYVEREAQEARLKAKQVNSGGGEAATVKCKQQGA